MKYFEVCFSLTPHTDDFCDVLSALLAEEAAFESFVPTENGIKAYVQQAAFSAEKVEQLIEAFPLPNVQIGFQVAEAEDKNWNEAWEQEGFSPICIGTDIYVHDTRYATNPNVRFDININPCQAFGTGSHQTTRMIMRHLLECPLENSRVVDAGCGTGILSILAAKLGALSVMAYDIDEWSVRNAQKNCELNHVVNVEIHEGNATILPNNAGFDWLIANINRNILLQDMPRFSAALREHGHLLLSGFYKQDIPVLQQQASELGLRITAQKHDEEWAMLEFVKE